MKKTKVRIQKVEIRMSAKQKRMARLAGREAIRKGEREYNERKERAIRAAEMVERERFRREKIGFFALWGIVIFVAGLIAGWML